MKNPSNTLGYFTVFFVALYAVFKFTLLPGANVIMILAGILIAIYFPLLFLNQLQKRYDKKPMLVYKFGAFLLSMIIISVVFRFNDWSLMGFKGDQAIRLFTLPSWIYIVPYCCISLVFIPWLIYTQYLENKKRLIKNIIGGIGLALITMSLIALDYHLPLSKVSFQIANILLILFFLPLHIRMTKKENKRLDYTFQTLIIAYILVIIIYLVFWRSPVTYLDVIKDL